MLKTKTEEFVPAHPLINPSLLLPQQCWSPKQSHNMVKIAKRGLSTELDESYNRTFSPKKTFLVAP